MIQGANADAPDGEELKKKIEKALELQGYAIQDGKISLPPNANKDTYRQVQQLAVQKKLSTAEGVLRRREDVLLQFIANGTEVEPFAISPKLVLVQPNSIHELLFRYASLHWSIPVSSGYGRRIRFLIFDENNGKLIGLFGLHDPVYAMRARDAWIGWTNDEKKRKLYHVMDAYVLGSVPPYSALLGGKLVALLTLCNEVRQEFRRKYAGTKSLIKGESRQPYLAMLTTTSALGRSSIYNRIRVDGFNYWTGLGFTQGSGEFHFSNGVYQYVRSFVEHNCVATAKNPLWGTGFRNKREVIRKCLAKLDLSSDLIYHGIQREIFAAPLGRKSLEFLRGESAYPGFYDWPAKHLFNVFNKRWLVKRAANSDYSQFLRDNYRLWYD